MRPIKFVFYPLVEYTEKGHRSLKLPRKNERFCKFVKKKPIVSPLHRDFSAYVGAEVIAVRPREHFCGPIILSVVTHWQQQTAREVHTTARGDVDSVVSAVLDGLKGTWLLADDIDVELLIASKEFDRENPRVEVEAIPMHPDNRPRVTEVIQEWVSRKERMWVSGTMVKR